MSTHPFDFTPVTANNMHKMTIPHNSSPSSISSAGSSRSINRTLTLSTHLNTNLLDVDFLPLPSPYSPLPASSDSSIHSTFFSHTTPSRPQQPRSAQTSPLPTTTDSTSDIRFMSLNFDTYSPGTSPGTGPPQRATQTQSPRIDQVLNDASEWGLIQPTPKKSKVGYEGRTRRHSTRSTSSDTSIGSSTSRF